MRGDRLTTLAGFLAAFTALVHTCGGTYEIHDPLLSSSLPRPVALLLYACWHLVTVSLWVSAWALLRPPKPLAVQALAAVARVIGLLWLYFGLVFIAVAVLIGGSASMLLELPQWILLLPVGALALGGSRRLQREHQ